MTITEKNIWEDTFKTLFNEVRFKKEKNVIYVFNGKSIRKRLRTKQKGFFDILVMNDLLGWWNW